jgi:hypothetical protein
MWIVAPAAVIAGLSLLLGACHSPAAYDTLLRGGTIYDGSGRLD